MSKLAVGWHVDVLFVECMNDRTNVVFPTPGPPMTIMVQSPPYTVVSITFRQCDDNRNRNGNGGDDVCQFIDLVSKIDTLFQSTLIAPIGL